ncbi:DUF4426 domain-containing protein [Marinobacter bryozoorum]|uniref:DUF4426 domain-containing protein n=1 Tax=Marinobacter bryozoorum TaxID=256324 RepID=UPI0020040060|nr:DUF4426 domain-containing protein [Marinobacter bryozoorum]MCK7544550.1 DUF4426 domain-containing protein [Marinobacter bryozoorum]
MKPVNLLILLCLTLAGLASPALAEEKHVRFGNYEVHYNVFPSTFLTPEVAAANDLNRSRGIGIVNIAIMDRGDDGSLTTVPGQVEGRALNEIQQPTFLAFRRIQEGDAVYFIAEYQYSEGELMTFQITARPSGHDQDLPIRFSQALFND